MVWITKFGVGAGDTSPLLPCCWHSKSKSLWQWKRMVCYDTITLESTLEPTIIGISRAQSHSQDHLILKEAKGRLSHQKTLVASWCSSWLFRAMRYHLPIRLLLQSTIWDSFKIVKPQKSLNRSGFIDLSISLLGYAIVIFINQTHLLTL